MKNYKSFESPEPVKKNLPEFGKNVLIENDGKIMLGRLDADGWVLVNFLTNPHVQGVTRWMELPSMDSGKWNEA